MGKSEERSRVSTAAFQMLIVTLITLTYWTAENYYFANLSVRTSFVLSLTEICLVMTWWTHSFYSRVTPLSAGPPKSSDGLLKKITLLENRVFELKADNSRLNIALSDPNRRGSMPDPKLGVLNRQRVFLHDLATKIQLLQIAADGAREAADAMSDENAHLIKARLSALENHLKEIVELHKLNRDFIILAA